MEWHGDEVLRKAEAEIGRGVQRAAIHLQNEIRKEISIPSRTVTQSPITKGKNKGKMRKVLGARGSSRSKPGEPPHKDTGALRSSIAHEMTGSMKALVGSAAKVAKWMELGTVGGKIIRPVSKKALANKAAGIIFGKRVKQGAIAPRPFIRSTMNKNRAEIIRLVGNGGQP